MLDVSLRTRHPADVGGRDGGRSPGCCLGRRKSESGSAPAALAASYAASQHSRCSGRISSAMNQTPRFRPEAGLPQTTQVSVRSMRHPRQVSIMKSTPRTRRSRELLGPLHSRCQSGSPRARALRALQEAHDTAPTVICVPRRLTRAASGATLTDGRGIVRSCDGERAVRNLRSVTDTQRRRLRISVEDGHLSVKGE